jgi:ABC-type glycerol-3-phosphate transport system substrate-binding protein
MGAQGMMGRMMGAGVLALLLAACGQGSENADVSATAEGDTRIALQGDDGERVTIQGGQSGQTDLPDGFTVYPGATVTSSTTINTGTGGGVIMVMSSPDGAEKVIDFYRTQAEAAGVTISQNATAGNNRIIGGQSADGLALTASAAPGVNGVTIIQLTVGRD